MKVKSVFQCFSVFFILSTFFILLKAVLWDCLFLPVQNKTYRDIFYSIVYKLTHLWFSINVIRSDRFWVGNFVNIFFPSDCGRFIYNMTFKLIFVLAFIHIVEGSLPRGSKVVNDVIGGESSTRGWDCGGHWRVGFCARSVLTHFCCIRSLLRFVEFVGKAWNGEVNWF